MGKAELDDCSYALAILTRTHAFFRKMTSEQGVTTMDVSSTPEEEPKTLGFKNVLNQIKAHLTKEELPTCDEEAVALFVRALNEYAVQRDQEPLKPKTSWIEKLSILQLRPQQWSYPPR
ncbi:MAG: hypothetical protein ACOYNL_00790 [Rickettsiales bacterium]